MGADGSFGFTGASPANTLGRAALPASAAAASGAWAHVVVTVNATHPNDGVRVYRDGIKAAAATAWTLAYDLTIPRTGANWNTYSDVPYTVDRCASIAAGSFHRVAYEFSLDDRTIWVEFNTMTTDPCKLGIPTDWVFDQTVEGLTVIDSAGLLDRTNEIGCVATHKHSGEGPRIAYSYVELIDCLSPTLSVYLVCMFSQVPRVLVALL